MPISGIFGYRILPSGKIRARKAQSKKSLLDFFDKLKNGVQMHAVFYVGFTVI